MSNLICVNNGPLRNAFGELKCAPQLKENEYYTAKGEDENSYQLVEIKTPFGYSGFDKRRFVPTSDIDGVKECEKLWRFLESDFYETYLNKKK